MANAIHRWCLEVNSQNEFKGFEWFEGGEK